MNKYNIIKEFAEKEDVYKIYSRNATIFSGSAFAFYCKKYLKELFDFDFGEMHLNTNEFVEAYARSSEIDEVKKVVRKRIEKAESIKDYYEDFALPMFDRFIILAKELREKYKTAQPKEELIKDYLEYTNTFARLVAILYYIFFSDYVIDPWMRSKILKHLKGDASKVDEYMKIISTPVKKTAVVNERKDFLKLIINGYNEKNLQVHADIYGWFPIYNPSDKRHGVDFYMKEAEQISPKEAKKELDNIEVKEKAHLEKFRKIMDEIQDKETKKLANLTNWFSHYREYRNDIRREGLSFGSNLLTRVGDFLGLSVTEACYLDFDEIKEYLEKETVDKEKARKRIKSYVSLGINGTNYIIDDEEGAQDIKNIIYDKIKNIKELKGSVSCKGYAKGRAVVIDNIKMLNEIEEGDILIASMTSPDYVPAMRKSGAIVTDEGGITCHAAVVSRELNVPCIVGTKNATQVFKTDDIVEVDATKGIVRKIG